MSATITIDAAGRLVLPKSMRDRLHLRAGTRLKAEIVAGRIELAPEINDDESVKLVQKGRRLVISGVRSTGDTVEGILKDREERMENLLPE